MKALLPQLAASMPQGVKVDTVERSHRDRARVGARRGAHARHHDRARRARHLRVLARSPRDGDPRDCRSALARRHVRRDVRDRVQLEQPLADGAHHRDGVRRRRRDRHGREHRALHRGGRSADARGAQRRQADRLHVVSLTVSLVCVLIPLLFMGGIVGRLFREFAVTLAAAIGVSLVISLTLTPMMTRAPLALRNGADAREGLRAQRARVRRHDRISTIAGCAGSSSTA